VEILINALDDCLEKMRAGATMDEVLANYPELGEELRFLLQTADAARSLRMEQPISTSAMARSRARFLRTQRSKAAGNSFRSSAALAYGVIIGIVILLWTGIASAQALPGDVFYPVKLASENTQLLLTNNPMARLSLQENFDLQRAQEIDALMAKERSIDATFAGFLTQKEPNQWIVAGIPLIFPQPLQSQAEQMVGKYVDVTGFPQSDGSFMVEQLQMRQFDLIATINAIHNGDWIASQMTLTITPDTVIEGHPFVGGQAQFTIIQAEDNTLEAISVHMLSSNMALSSPTPVSTHRELSGQSPSSEDKNNPSLNPATDSNSQSGTDQTQAGNKSSTSRDKENHGSNKSSDHSSTPRMSGNPPGQDNSPHNNTYQPTPENNDPGKTPEPGSSDNQDN
jgi:hypothetical protein